MGDAAEDTEEIRVKCDRCGKVLPSEFIRKIGPNYLCDGCPGKRGRKVGTLPVPVPVPILRGAPVRLVPWLELGNIVRVGRFFAVIVGLPEHEWPNPGHRFGEATPAVGIRRVNKSGYFCKSREWVPLREVKRAAYSWRVRLRAAIAYRLQTEKHGGPWEVAAHEPGGSPERAWSVRAGYRFDTHARAAAERMNAAPENSVDPLCYFARLSV